ncbi:uncharacterized protein PAC_00095 [Phialocephala subalpina]|uniref:GrpB domain protein n=1 Tax=Phialocephala subalpina TaxID=576137 RepID=A0A1L7WBR4_9HELO|nr:uncharacterized protein PAC_00095 [Phialocephala subalpina]
MYRDWYTAPLIELEEHNPAWAGEFLIAKTSLENLLQGLPIISIEHVGSTSIPDLVSKPILDIDIVINKDDFVPILDKMREGGYTYIGECGMPGRHSFFQPNSDKTDGEPMGSWDDEVIGADGVKKLVRIYERRRNTYVCIEGSLSLRNHRDLKRILMEDAELKKEYGDRKKELVDDHQLRATDDDRLAYNVGKNEVVAKILKKAGWTDKELNIVCKGRGGFYGR